MNYKSKNDLATQINRIFRNHGTHRLYSVAFAIYLRYNDNISNTKEYCHIYNQFRKEEDTKKRYELFDTLSIMKFPSCRYMKNK